MWTTKDMSAQTGKIAIVTGANTGIGYEIALALYRAGAHVIMACRDLAKAEEATQRMKQEGGAGTLEGALIDLSRLDSVRSFAHLLLERYENLDLLINNAGIMVPPAGKTVDGFELQFGINFLGHFALTGHLLPLLSKTNGARVVTLSSGAHHLVNGIDYENLRLEKPYDAQREYAVSKLANILFSIELQRRIEQTGMSLISNAAHPGVTDSNLSRYMPADVYETAVKQFNGLMPTWQGALPALYAATSPAAQGGLYYGPDGEDGLHGYPAEAQVSSAAADEAEAAKLWRYAETATGVSYSF